jgi:uncharacterized membrane-anchored protein
MLASLCFVALASPNFRAQEPAANASSKPQSDPAKEPAAQTAPEEKPAAQAAPDEKPAGQESSQHEPTAEEKQALRARFLAEIEAREGPFVGDLGSASEIDVPEGFVFAGAKGTQHFLEMNQNPTAGDEVGMLMPWRDDDLGSWFVCFSYRDTGYVKDDEKDKLDADALLARMRESTKAGNEERKKRGWEPLDLVGWTRAPFYDPATHNLTWATRLKSSHGESVNWSTRLLGRKGTVDVDLVVNPDKLDASLPKFQQAIAGFRFRPGERYAEYRAGDKVAEYGLGALVLGGAGVAAAKTGLLAKFWKVIVLGFAAVASFFRRMWAKIAGSRPDKRTEISDGG